MELPSTIKQCHQLLFHLEADNARLHDLMESLLERIFQLERQLGKNSSNSSKPPSTDHFFKKTTSVAIAPSNKSKGGQVGHKGDTLKMVETADEIIQHIPLKCTCGASLAGIEPVLTQKRQLFDLPTIRFEVQEHQVFTCDCPHCGEKNTANFPANIKAPVQYGNQTKAFSVLLNNTCQVSFRKISKLIDNLTGQKINQTTLQSANDEAFLALEALEKANIEDLKKAEVVYADETGMRIAGAGKYLHTVANATTTHLWASIGRHSVHRGLNAHSEEKSPLIGFQNTIMHDRFQTYNKFEKASHLYCNAHLMRDLQSLCEQNYEWAVRLRRGFRQLYRMSKDKEIPARFKQRIDQWFAQIVTKALQAEPPPKPNKVNQRLLRTEARNLLEFFQNHQGEVLAFAFNQAMPFSNNLAEQALRHTKTKIKVIGGFRIFKGTDAYARCQGVFDTWRKRGLSAFENLKMALALYQNQPGKA